MHDIGFDLAGQDEAIVEAIILLDDVLAAARLGIAALAQFRAARPKHKARSAACPQRPRRVKNAPIDLELVIISGVVEYIDK
ncbi:hypothetical protein NKI32_31315 [Mesorhizobium sp. M0761]|uniref:hypothetical protein n=1 Tax=Mesorhizobium sp. M0761 TaxID=2956994 RepID=UPI003337E2A3